MSNATAPRVGSACATCGASQGVPPPLYCRFCGARRAGGVDASFRTDPERYQLVERDPAYPGAMRHAPRLAAGEVVTQLAIFVAAVVIAGLGRGAVGHGFGFGFGFGHRFGLGLGFGVLRWP